MKRLNLLLLVTLMVACTNSRPSVTTVASMPVTADSAMVVSAHPLASKIGANIMQEGGNAIDASIATQFALAVVFPAAGNIGGGGFMLIRFANGESYSLDYREKAPHNARATMFQDENGNVAEGLSEDTHLAAGVPGTVAGLVEAHRRFGQLPWHTLVQPAIDLALNGFALTQKEAKALNSIQDALKKHNTIAPSYLIKDNWKAGDSLFLHDLGRTLERIRDAGLKGFYEGKTADDIVNEMNRGNGIITHEDLKQYQPVWRSPIKGTYKNYSVISMAPPSSGGIALLQLLNAVEQRPVNEWGHNSASSIHLFTEAQRRVYADRAHYLGDPDFVKVPVKALVAKEYIGERMKSYDADNATPSASVQEGEITISESTQTTHLSIVDKEGNAVAVTTTLNDSYGSKIVVPGSGFFLNNEMDDFSAKPGVPNMYGAIGGEANKIEPHKRMLSSMTPTILEKDNKLFMVVGTPGGTTIITSVFQTIMNVVEFNMNMQDAVAAKRVHSQWFPDEVFFEDGALSEEALAELKKKGHILTRWQSGLGRVDAIRIRDDGKLEGGADPRGDDTAIGF